MRQLGRAEGPGPAARWTECPRAVIAGIHSVCVQEHLYQKLEQGCSLEGSYAQVPATGEGDWDPGAAAGQTGCLSPAAGGDPHCVWVYIYLYVFPLTDLFPDQPGR